MMTRSSSSLGNILITHLPPPRSKRGDGPLVHREIYFKTKNSKETIPSQTTYHPASMVGAMDDRNVDVVPTPAPKLKSTIMGGTSQLGDGDPENTKIRGFRKETDVEFNSLSTDQK